MRGMYEGTGRVGLATALTVALAGLAACGDSTSGPADPPGGQIAAVVVSPATHTMNVGEGVQLTAVARTAAGAPVDGAVFVWESLDPAVATVSAVGLVTGVAEGSARVRATSGSRSGEATIRVDPINPTPTIVRFSPASVAAGGPDLTLTIVGTGFRPNVRLRWNGVTRPTTYLSDTEAQATIWAGDLAQVGDAEIEMINPGPGGGPSPVVRFAVVPQAVPVASIELHQEVAFSTVGAAVPMRWTLRDAGGAVLTDRLVTWSSSNQLVATVTGNGVVRPVGVGEVTITAESEGQRATLALSVGAAISHLVLDDGVGLATLDMRLGGAPAQFWAPAAGTRIVEPTVSSDPRWIAYTIEAGTSRSVAVLDLASRTYRYLTSDAASDQAAWSPTGDRIAFRSRRAGRPDIWVMNADGTGAINLTATMPPGFEAGWPAWSPDGSRLVFSAGLPASVSLYTIRADGAGVQPLLLSIEHDSEAAWRGDAVVFTRRAADGTTDLYRYPVGGGALIRLTRTGGARSPAWSPDGRWIAFADGPIVGGRSDLKAVRPFGDEIRMLSAVGAGGGGQHPTWLTHQ